MRRPPFVLVLALLAAAACGRVPGQEVRYEPTPMPAVRAMLELAAVGPGDVVYDLGSGDGRIVITAAREFGARGVGIEIHPSLVERARANAREAGVADRVEFRLGNMHDADLAPATVVTLFLHPGPNMKLRPKLRRELRPGARVVSYVWDMGDWTPDDARTLNRRRIFLWRVGADTQAWRHNTIGHRKMAAAPWDHVAASSSAMSPAASAKPQGSSRAW